MKITVACVVFLLSLSCGIEEPSMGSEAVSVNRSGIVNGQISSREGVGGLYVVEQGRASFFCSAARIGPQALLTAAHCVYTEEGEVRPAGQMGYWEGTLPPDHAQMLTPIVAVKPHANYINRESALAPTTEIQFDGKPLEIRYSQNDIAILHLAKPWKGPVPFAVSSTRGANNTPITVVGAGNTHWLWGGAGTLREGKNVIAGTTPVGFYYYGASGNTSNLCQGDSGGPTLVEEAGNWRIVGVHSMGTCKDLAGAKDSILGFDIWVSDYFQWINESLSLERKPASEPSLNVEARPRATTSYYDLTFSVTSSTPLESASVQVNGNQQWQNQWKFRDVPEKHYVTVSLPSALESSITVTATDLTGATQSHTWSVVREDIEREQALFNKNEDRPWYASCQSVGGGPGLSVLLLTALMRRRRKNKVGTSL